MTPLRVDIQDKETSTAFPRGPVALPKYSLSSVLGSIKVIALGTVKTEIIGESQSVGIPDSGKIIVTVPDDKTLLAAGAGSVGVVVSSGGVIIMSGTSVDGATIYWDTPEGSATKASMFPYWDSATLQVPASTNSAQVLSLTVLYASTASIIYSASLST